MQDQNIVHEFEALSNKMGAAREALGRVIFGQDEVIGLTLTALAAGGHGLLVGAPGLAKTLLVTSIGDALGLSSKRVQFTPDLMPGDILGSEVLEENEDAKRVFRFIKGPIFCQLLMADEINRASPRTQSALLQAMQEQFVTVAGESHQLPEPFHVLATQNPIEQEGTYPLPEAQLDRFLMQIDVPFPDEASERRMLAETTTGKSITLDAALSPVELRQVQDMVRAMPIGEQVIDAILNLVRTARPGPDAGDRVNKLVAWGPGPRASQALSLAARAYALIEGRPAPSLDDIRHLAGPILKHRMSLNFSARAEGITIDDFIGELCNQAF